MATPFFSNYNTYGDLDDLPAADVTALANDLDTTRASRSAVNVAGTGDYTLLAAEYERVVLEFTGALTGARGGVVPLTAGGRWWVRNNTSGAFSLTVKGASGTGIVIRQGYAALVWTDGTNVLRATPDLSQADVAVLTGVNDTNGNEVVIVSPTASAVNEITLTNAATGNRPRLSATGDDTNIGLSLRPKGTGTIVLEDNNGNEVLIAGPAVASAVNEITASNAAASGKPNLTLSGGDANISGELIGKGTGGWAIGSGGAPIAKTLKGETTWDPASIADGDDLSTTVTVTGAAVGDVAVASLSTLGANDILISAHVQAADTVRVVLLNRSGGAFDAASGTLRAVVFKMV